MDEYRSGTLFLRRTARSFFSPRAPSDFPLPSRHQCGCMHLAHTSPLWLITLLYSFSCVAANGVPGAHAVHILVRLKLRQRARRGCALFSASCWRVSACLAPPRWRLLGMARLCLARRSVDLLNRHSYASPSASLDIACGALRK